MVHHNEELTRFSYREENLGWKQTETRKSEVEGQEGILSTSEEKLVVKTRGGVEGNAKSLLL